MLAHFALSGAVSTPRSRSLLTRTILASSLVAGHVLTSATPALGADTLPLGGLDARAVGKVSSADVAAKGSLATGLSIEAAEAVVPGGGLGRAAPDGTALLRDANRASVFLGVGITNRLELTIGLHGSYEHVKPEERDALFPVEDGAQSDLTWRDSTKQTGFSGASVFLKMKLLDWDGLRLAVAPFVESGAGDQATYSLTRSVGPKAGFMTIASYGAAGVADVTLNAGYRYRDPESLGDVTLRHEQFARAQIRAYASRDFSLFVAGDGRRLLVAENLEIDDASGKKLYERQESGEVKGGFTVRLGETELSAFGGGRPKNAGGFGFGKVSYGLAMTTSIGSVRGDRGGRSYAAEIEDEEAEKAAKAAASAEIVPAKAATDEYPEMIGADIDPLEALAGDEAPDFKDVNDRSKRYEQEAKVESPDAKVERELKALKEAEAKAAADRATVAEAERAKARREAAKQMKEDDELLREYMKEAKHEADALDSIEQDEMEWNGLE